MIYEIASDADPLSDAASDMLAALKLAEERLEICNLGGDENEALAQIRKAIDKAEGNANG